MEILTALLDLLLALGALCLAVGSSLLPWIPLLAWIAFWMLAVDWRRLRVVQLSGGILGLVLLGLVAVLVWAVIAPPAGGRHSLLGLEVTNLTGKLIYVTALIVIMQLCGAVQLSGCCDSLLSLELPESGAGGHEGHGVDHGHHESAHHGDGHGGHGQPEAAHGGGH